ncbi:MAG TPA: DUF1993 domain-containing protein [Caulobacteraceae bacterium]
MAVNAYAFVGMYSHALDTAAHLLTKGAEFAAANGVGGTELLDWRLIDDMQPLAFQLMVVCNFSRQWPARVAGLPVPPDVGADLDLAGFRDAIAAAKTYLATLKPEQFEDRDELALTHTIGTGMTLTLPAGRWLTIFATTNLYFHLSTAYDILRSKGVQIGKPDLFAGGL